MPMPNVNWSYLRTLAHKVLVRGANILKWLFAAFWGRIVLFVGIFYLSMWIGIGLHMDRPGTMLGIMALTGLYLYAFVPLRRKVRKLRKS